MKFTKTTRLKVAIRSSQLSQIQFKEFNQLFNNNSKEEHIALEAILMQSPGDRDKAHSLLDELTAEDFFTQDLDNAVLNGTCDCALHSAKDLPWPLPKGLSVWALSLAEVQHDELCSKKNYSLETLPKNARVATSSALRRESLLSLRPDLEIVSIRGTIEERLACLETGKADALVVAACALKRLGLAQGVPLPIETHPLQGRLALVGKQTEARLKNLFLDLDVRKNWGSVTLLGAGPGNADLISVWGKRLLNQADIIFYDALLDLRLVDNLQAETIFVGKRKKLHEKKQAEINYLLYQAALEGKRVVRLKGGDPLIFGRASEEAEYLARRLVDYQIIPGISSAQAAAAFAGIPLSERGKATSVSLVNAWPAEKIRWTNADTNVFFMASEAGAEIRAKALEAGVSENTNFVWIRNAAAQSQITKTIKLVNLDKETLPEGDGPILLIGGPSADKRAGNDWFDRQSRVLWTGSEMPSEAQLQKLSIGLCRATHLPFIKIIQLTEEEFLEPKLEVLFKRPFNFDWLFFTSRNAVEAYMHLLNQKGLDLRVLFGLKIAAIGQTTKESLETFGIKADLTAEQEDSQGLVKAFSHYNQNQGPKRIVMPRSDKALDLIPRLLREEGHQLECVTIYHTVPIDQSAHITIDQLQNFEHIVFTSPSTVKSFFESFPALLEPTPEAELWWQRVLLHCRGQQTKTALQDFL